MQSRPLTLPEPGLTVSAQTAWCECKTCSTTDKTGKESWNCWAPGGGLVKQALGQQHSKFYMAKQTPLTWKQSFNLFTGWWMTDYKPWTTILRDSPKEWMHGLGPLPSWDSVCAVTWDFPMLFKSGWEQIQFGEVCIIALLCCFSFLLMLVKKVS